MHANVSTKQASAHPQERSTLEQHAPSSRGQVPATADLNSHTDSQSHQMCTDDDNEGDERDVTAADDEVRPTSLSRSARAKQLWLTAAQRTADSIRHTLETLHAQRRWQVVVLHVERVKSYAPHVDHVVFDLHCVPKASSPLR